jgi:hypothetical protein
MSTLVLGHGGVVSSNRHDAFPPTVKTDISAGIGLPVTASRLALPGGDVAVLVGWSISETTGAATASFRLHDGKDATTPQFTRVNLAANESNRDTIGRNGAICFSGRVFLAVVSGSIEGVLFWLPGKH